MLSLNAHLEADVTEQGERHRRDLRVRAALAREHINDERNHARGDQLLAHLVSVGWTPSERT